MPKPKSTKHWDDVLRGIRDPERYDPKARSFGGPWRMVKCKDGAYVCYELYLEVMENLRKSAEINPAQSPHDGIHTCSKGCKKPGCNRGLRDTIEEQNAQIEALKQDLLEQAAAVRHLRMERVHDLNHIGGQQEENARLKAEVERLTAENAAVKLGNAEWKATAIERLDELIHDNRTIYNLKAEVERLTNENGNNSVLKEEWYLKCLSARAEVERLRKAGDAMSDHLAHEFGTCPSIEIWNAAKEGQP